MKNKCTLRTMGYKSSKILINRLKIRMKIIITKRFSKYNNNKIINLYNNNK